MDQHGNKPAAAQHRVELSMKDLEAILGLKAVQERFGIWNEQELKTLMMLFDKPYIVQ